ncbi:MAG: Diacylglycerol kinase, partial [Thermoleophilia bacterium]|nr:Diacylglycerol kinase [Thermoleophilia bacterium]
MRVLLVQNDRSGSADAVDPEAVLVEQGCSVDVVDIAGAAARRGAAAAGAGKPDRVVVAGGDGSVGVAAALAHAWDIPLGVIPSGTANDFARAMSLPVDHAEAARLAATGQNLRGVDLGCLDGQHSFVNVASVGLAPAAADRAARLKGTLGPL